jgi:hypothetical protein
MNGEFLIHFIKSPIGQKIIPRSIGSIVKEFKIGITKWFRNNTDIENVWQRN